MDTKGIDSILSQLRAAAAVAAGKPASVAPPASGAAAFSEVLKASLDQANALQHNATSSAQAFEKGAPDAQLHEVMISLQKANVSFQQMVQVRNRLVSAYHDIMNMQV